MFKHHILKHRLFQPGVVQTANNFKFAVQEPWKGQWKNMLIFIKSDLVQFKDNDSPLTILMQTAWPPWKPHRMYGFVFSLANPSRKSGFGLALDVLKLGNCLANLYASAAFVFRLDHLVARFGCHDWLLATARLIQGQLEQT